MWLKKKPEYEPEERDGRDHGELSFHPLAFTMFPYPFGGRSRGRIFEPFELAFAGRTPFTRFQFEEEGICMVMTDIRKTATE